MFQLKDLPNSLQVKVKKKLGIKKKREKRSKGLSESNLHSHIMKALRKKWAYEWPARKAVLKMSQVSKEHHKCDDCLKIFHKSNIEVHHIEPVASHLRDYNMIINRLFCDEGGLKVLCKGCHALYR